jgi:Alternative complex III, ActD subunit
MRRTKKHLLFATFGDFDKARDAVTELKMLDLKELVVEEIELYSPIEHPEVEEMLGEFHQPIQRFTFFGALTGALCAFLLVAAAAQSMFTVQPQGGKPVIPLPPDIVITYEGTILFGVLSTLAAFFIYAGLPRRLKKYYNQKVSEDHIGIEVQMKPENTEKVRMAFEKCGALEIREVTQ